MAERTIELVANRVFGSGQTVENQGGFASQGFEQRIHHLAGVACGQGVLGGGAEVGGARGLGSVPSLPVINSPGVDHNHGRRAGLKPVRHFDDAASVIGKSPGADVEIGMVVVDQQRRFVASKFCDRFDEFWMIGEEWRWIVKESQSVVIGTRLIHWLRFAGRL